MGYRESFGDLSEDYLKYQAVRKTLRSLAQKAYVTEKSDVHSINPIVKLGFIQRHPIAIDRALDINNEYRKQHILEFDTSSVEEYLLNEDVFPEAPYGLIGNLGEAMKLHRMESYDSVLVKCGKCVETMVDEMNNDYSLFSKNLSTGAMILRLRDTEMASKIEAVDRGDLRTFVDGISVVYRFRNMMGAHAGVEWGIDQAATSCLILTFYLVDLYLWRVRKGT